MPLVFNDYQRRRVLQDRGFDPNFFDIDPESGAIGYKAPKEQPSVTNPSPVPEVSIKPRTSGLEAAGIGIASGLAPTLTGAGGASVLGRLGATIGEPAGLPGMAIGGGIGSAIGAFGGGVLGEKLQQMIIPKNLEELQQTAAAEHPFIYPASRFASSLVAFKPDLKAAREAIGTGGNLLSRLLPGVGAEAPLTASQIQNFANVAAGAGLGAGIPAAEHLIRGEKIN